MRKDKKIKTLQDATQSLIDSIYAGLNKLPKRITYDKHKVKKVLD